MTDVELKEIVPNLLPIVVSNETYPQIAEASWSLGSVADVVDVVSLVDIPE